MAKLPENEQLRDSSGRALLSLADLNSLPTAEKEKLYSGLLPQRLFELFDIDPVSFRGADGGRKIDFIAPAGLGLLRLEVRLHPEDRDRVFFLELAFCVISNPDAPRFHVDIDSAGRDNCFTTMGRNIPEEVRAMAAGLFPNQCRRGLRMFGEFFPRLERFVDALGMEMIVAEPLTYDNAIRYEKYGFDYLTGRRLMQEISRGFQPGGSLYSRLDGSSPFRTQELARTVRGRSWAIHDGIMDQHWNGVRIYKMVGQSPQIDTFPDREREEESS
jgi:hypothetical protein